MATDFPTIPPVEEYNALSVADRIEVLRKLRAVYADKQIRDTWGMKYAKYHYEVQKIAKADAKKGSSRPESIIGDKDTWKEPEAPQSPPGRSGPIIEAEFSVIPEVEQSAPASNNLPVVTNIPQAAAEPVELPMLNYENVTGDVRQIDKRLATILQLLEMDGPEARFRLNIQVYKA